jgi:general secretion pathway protein K
MSGSLRPGHRARPGLRRRQRGAALLLAMLIVVLVVTLTSSMVWQQTRAIEVEGAERARAQSAWILNGALDWARLILAEDARNDSQRGERKYDALDEPWATPLAEARLSTFLAQDRDNNVDTGPEAFISGSITDAQSRYNLRNLVDAQGKLSEVEVEGFTQLVRAAGLPDDTASQVALALEPLWTVREGPPPADLPLTPTRVSELVWLGLDPARVAALAPWVEILPTPTPVNANTAPREVLLAAIGGLDMGGAERLVQARQRQPLRSLDEINEILGGTAAIAERVNVVSRHFEITGRLRLEQRVLEQRALVQRGDTARGADVIMLRLDRVSVFE